MEERRIRKKRKNKRLARFIILAVLIVGCASAFWALKPGGGGESSQDGQAGSTAGAEITEQGKQEPISLSISCVGDIMVHESQIPAQYDSGTDTYDFWNNFVYVRKYIDTSDLALCNLETTFGGKPYTGYPAFSAPDELAGAIEDAGFDVAITANNHMMDKGLAGLTRTVDILKTAGLEVTGSRTEPQQARYAVVEVKGVKVGIVAYTYASSSQSGGTLINGSAISGEAAELINYFRYEHIDEDLGRVKEAIDGARNAGAEIIIAYYHWGNEYYLEPNDLQRYIAEKTASELGADMIFASHTHTIQETDLITVESTGKQVPVFYSMGNFISNQRRETLDVQNVEYTEIGMIARVNLDYDPDGGKITGISMAAVPTWVEKYKAGGKNVYTVIPLDDALADNEELAVSGHLARAQKAWEDANGILKYN